MEFSHGCLEFLPKPTTTHQRILKLLFNLLEAFVAGRGLAEALTAGIRVQVGEDRYREPDIVFLRTENASRALERYWIGADLVMEIVSDDDPSRDVITKRLEYAQAGIAEYWIVDRREGRITVLTLAGSSYAVHTVNLREVTKRRPSFFLDSAWMWRRC